MNEDDEKLNTSTVEDRRSILIIGGIKIFFSSIQGEASICVAGVAAEEEHCW
jgi:hypothetical protein